MTPAAIALLNAITKHSASLEGNLRTHQAAHPTPQTVTPNVIAGLEWQRLGPEHKDLFESYVKLYPQRICELTFPSLLCWSSVQPYFVAEFANHLFIFFIFGNAVTLLQPIGPHPEQFLAALPGAPWKRIDADFVDRMTGEHSFVETRYDFDYLYRLSDLCSLKGRKYHEKRRFIHRCEEYHPVVVPLHSSMWRECQSVLDEWRKEKVHTSDDADCRAVETALTLCETIGLHGIAVKINGQVESFGIGSPGTHDTFVAHFMKAKQGFTGLYTFTMNAFARSIPSQYQYLNLEQDIGIPGLRTAKERWNPCGFVKKYANLGNTEHPTVCIDGKASVPSLRP